jgi:hypothetical protein
MKPTIFFIVPRLGLGGLELFLLRLIPFLQTKFRIILISLDSADILTKSFENKKITIEHLNIFSLFSVVHSLKKFNFLIKKYNPIYIQSFLYPADVFTILVKFFLRNKIPIIWSLRTNGIPHRSKILTKLYFFLVIMFSKIVPNKILSCSMEASARHISVGYTPKNHYVIPNFPEEWTNNSKSKSILLRKKNCDEITIGYSARYAAGKSHELLCQLLKLLNSNTQIKFKLSFCGQATNLYGDLYNFVKENYPIVLNSIEFCGNLFGAKYSSWHQQIDIFCLPSITEGIPNSFLEACSIGTPVIGTALATVKLMSDDKLLIDPNKLNIYTLTDKINFWLNLDLPDRNKICDKNKRMSLKAYNQKEIVNSYLSFYTF